MKNMTTKLLTATLSLSIVIFLSFAFSAPQTNGNKYLTMRTIETPMGGGSKITIVYPDGKTEELDLNKMGNSENAIKIHQAINSIANKGYELVSSNGIDIAATYIFVKK